MKKQLNHVYWDRTAYVYVRQSTGAQILEHTESTKRQYGLAERARALGWSPTKITVKTASVTQKSAARRSLSRTTRNVGGR